VRQKSEANSRYLCTARLYAPLKKTKGSTYTMRSTLSALNNTLHAFVVPLSSFFFVDIYLWLFHSFDCYREGREKSGQECLGKRNTCTQFVSMRKGLLTSWLADRRQCCCSRAYIHSSHQLPLFQSSAASNPPPARPFLPPCSHRSDWSSYLLLPCMWNIRLLEFLAVDDSRYIVDVATNLKLIVPYVVGVQKPFD